MDVPEPRWPLRHVGVVLAWDLRTALRRPATWLLFGVLCLLAAGSFSWLLALLARGGGLTLQQGDDPIVQFLGPNVFLVGTITLLVPLLTMNLVADERRRGTWDLWWTTGLGRGEWLLARGVAAWLQLLFGLLPWFVYAMTLRLWTGGTQWIGGIFPWFASGGLAFDLGVTAGGLIGLMLIGLTFCMLGLLVSSLCRNPVGAAFGTLAVLVAVLSASIALPVAERAGVEPRLLQVLETIACWQHQEAFSQGRIVPGIVAGHLGVSLLLWALATWSLEGFRLHNLKRFEAVFVMCGVGASFGMALSRQPPFDMTVSRVHTLAPQTQNLLRSIDAPIEVVIVAPADARTAEEQRFQPAVSLVRQLTAQCAVVNRLVSCRSIESTSETEVLEGVDAPCVVVKIADRTAVLRARDLISYRLSGRNVEAIAFHGEQALAAALARLSSAEGARVVRFVTGHGELVPPVDGIELTSGQRTQATLDNEPSGITTFAGRLRELGWQVESIDLARSPIPADTAVLVVAGSREGWTAAECERLRAWLRNGGRALVLCETVRDPATGEAVSGRLEAVLSEFGVSLGGANAQITTARRAETSHALVRSLPQAPVALFTPRVLVRPVSLQVTDREVLEVLREGEAVVAAAVEQKGRAALVVVGDSEFLTDRAVASAEGRSGFAFALSAVHWLQDRTELLGDIPPRVREPYQLSGTPEDRRGLIWKPLLVLLSLAATAGGVAWNRAQAG